MTRPSPIGFVFMLFPFLLGGCYDRYAFRRPEGVQALVQLPPPGATKERWPTAVPTTPAADRNVQAAGLNVAAAAGEVGSERFAPPAVKKLISPELIASRQGMARVEALAELACDRAKDMTCYYVRLRKREMVNGRAVPEDVVLFKFRSQPFSVHMKSLEESPTAGREIVFVNGKFNNELQVRAGKGDIIPGFRLSLSPTAPRAMENSRRTILDSGFPNIIARFVRAVNEEQTTPTGSLQALGPQQRPEYSGMLEVVKQTIAPGKDLQLPGGGLRHWYFPIDPGSPEYGLPMLITTFDDHNREVEYYSHDRLVLNVSLKDEDFDPDRLWARKR
jgi:hypothetical protein